MLKEKGLFRVIEFCWGETGDRLEVVFFPVARLCLDGAVVVSLWENGSGMGCGEPCC